MVGSKGTFYSPNDYGAEYTLFPVEDYKDIKKPEPTLPRLAGGEGDLNYSHFLEFAVACKGGPAAMSNFGYAGRLTEMVMPGDNVELIGELGSPIAMEQELRFAIREGGRTVGSGVVSEILE